MDRSATLLLAVIAASLGGAQGDKPDPDYRVLSADGIGGKVTDHGVALDITDVPWAGRQMWAPDAAEKDGKYFLYFPVKDVKVVELKHRADGSIETIDAYLD